MFSHAAHTRDVGLRTNLVRMLPFLGLSQQLSKLNSPVLDLSPQTIIHLSHAARNLGFMFDYRLTFSDQIGSLSKSFFNYIRSLRHIRPFINYSTANTVATFLVHYRLS
jgi:hypothetical protein